MLAIQAELDHFEKQKLEMTMKQYLTRAEELKRILTQVGNNQKGESNDNIKNFAAICCVCHQKIPLNVDFTTSDFGFSYHYICYPGNIGLSNQVSKSFLTGGSLVFFVALSNRVIYANYDLHFYVKIQNDAGKTVKCVSVHLVKQEQKKETKHCLREYFGGEKVLHNSKGVKELKGVYSFSDKLLPSQSGIGLREYLIVFTCCLSVLNEDLQISFPIQLKEYVL